jgi:uncharacterized protein DUF2795
VTPARSPHEDPGGRDGFLGGIDYPTDKQTLVERARERGADDNVIRMLESLPMDKFNSPNDASEAIGKMR